MVKGIDTATRITDDVAKILVDNGYSFVLRYLAPNTTLYQWKRLNLNETTLLSNYGLKIGAVYETSANRPTGGYNYGKIDGKRALDCAVENNIPDHGCIYFAVDFDAQPSDFDLIEEYFKGAKEQIGDHPIGIYGSYYTIEEMYKRNVADYYWQCVGWSKGNISDHADIYQKEWDKPYAGITVDFNEMYDKAGLWNLGEEMDGEKIWNALVEYLGEQETSEFAKESSIKGIESKAFKDGDGDGLVDNPKAPVTREQLAVVLNRLGLLG